MGGVESGVLLDIRICIINFLTITCVFCISQHAPLREEPPNDYRKLAIVSIFFCPLLGFLALFMSYVVSSNRCLYRLSMLSNQECFPFARIGWRPYRLVCKSMRHLESGSCCRILKNNHFENGTHCFEEIRRTRIKRLLQIGTLRLRIDRSVRPGLTNGKRPHITNFLDFMLMFIQFTVLPSHSVNKYIDVP